MSRNFSHDTGTSNFQHIKIESNRILTPIDKFQFLLREIENFHELEGNWDGYNAISPLKEVIETIKNLITILPPNLIDRVSDIYPNPHGTLVIEWMNQNGEKLLLEIGENNFSYFLKLNDENPKVINEQNILANIDLLSKDLDCLFRKEIRKYILS